MKSDHILEEIITYVGSARSVPMSSSAMVNRSELLDMLEQLRAELPGDLKQARDVVGRRDQILREATANAERLLVAAQEEKRQIVSEEEVVKAARIEAAEIIQAAREQSDQMSRQVDGYVDAKLAHLEVSVTNIVDAIRRGRTQLSENAGLYAELSAGQQNAAQDQLHAAPPAELAPSYEPDQFEAPRFEAPQHDVPQFDAQPYERPHYEPQQYETPQYETPQYDRPQYDRPQYDRPQYDDPAPYESVPQEPAPQEPVAAHGAAQGAVDETAAIPARFVPEVPSGTPAANGAPESEGDDSPDPGRV